MTWQIVTQQEGSARGGRGAPAPVAFRVLAPEKAAARGSRRALLRFLPAHRADLWLRALRGA